MHLDESDFSNSSDTQVSEQRWQELSSWLFPPVHMWVYYSGIRTWQGQYREIAEEIVQETILRTFKYIQRAECGEVPKIISLKALSKVIAQNHFRDRCKKDCRLIHMTQEDFLQGWDMSQERADLSQMACEQLVSDATVMAAAEIVAKFPRGQRLALLTDLANTAHLDEQPGLLERAFSEIGVRLRDYHRPLPTDQAERCKHSALLCIAYKRLRTTMQIAVSS